MAENDRARRDLGRADGADFDIAIIGGGINGTGLARDAAGRGLKVLLVEMNDLAAGTSSASSKLIHGGLRYLEHGAFRLVREALNEREVLLDIAPHVVRPMRFVLPPAPDMRAPLILRFGLFLYDWLGARKNLPASRTIDLTHNVVGQPLKRSFRYGFEYSDCWVDDSRLVVLNARDAADRGASIRTRTRCVRAERKERWELVLHDHGRRDVATAGADPVRARRRLDPRDRDGPLGDPVSTGAGEHAAGEHGTAEHREPSSPGAEGAGHWDPPNLNAPRPNAAGSPGGSRPPRGP